MGLNESKGDMYEWVTHTWNAIKGSCPHDCTYCYMKRWRHLKAPRLDKAELKTDMGGGNFIFVGSSCDMFAGDLPYEWVIKTLQHCAKFDNSYLFQTKNPHHFNLIDAVSLEKYVLCVTIETNRHYPEIMRHSPKPIDRGIQFDRIQHKEKYITIEPIMDFDVRELISMVRFCEPKQVNIGADSCGHKLPEPSGDKVRELIAGLEGFTTVKPKKNLHRLLRANEKIQQETPAAGEQSEKY